MPLGLLLKDSSATVIENTLTKSYEMSFQILMWSEEVKEAVFRYLFLIQGHKQIDLNFKVNRDILSDQNFFNYDIVWKKAK